jgi:hypothetical protein
LGCPKATASRMLSSPFADKNAAGKAGFDTSKAYKFEPFTPTLPEPRGDFHSFIG